MGFTFGNNLLEIEIVGTEYLIDPFAPGLISAMNEFRAKLSNLDLMDTPDSERIIETCRDVEKMVNAVLGDGAYSKIFAGRTVNLLDHWELAMHIISAAMAFRAKRITQFTIDGMSNSAAVMGNDDSGAGNIPDGTVQ